MQVQHYVLWTLIQSDPILRSFNCFFCQTSSFHRFIASFGLKWIVRPIRRASRSKISQANESSVKKTYLGKPGFNSQIFLVQRPKKASFKFLSDFSGYEFWKYMNNAKLCMLFLDPRIQLHQNNWLWCNFVVSFVYNVAFSVHFWSKLVFHRPDSDNSIVMEFQPI